MRVRLGSPGGPPQVALRTTETEPGGGSDAGATRTTARVEDGQWVINGTKAFITNAGTDVTALVTVTAVTGERDNGRKEISSILVPVPTDGFSASKKYSKGRVACIGHARA